MKGNIYETTRLSEWKIIVKIIKLLSRRKVYLGHNMYKSILLQKKVLYKDHHNKTILFIICSFE